MIALMIYSMFVGGVLLLGARASEALARKIGIPIRGLWAGAMLLTLAFSFLPRHAATPLELRVPVRVVDANGALGAVVSEDRTLWARARHVPVAARHALNDALDRVTSSTERWLPASFAAATGFVWALVGVAIAAIFWSVQRRMRRARRAWPMADVAGKRVRVSPEIGPLVSGVVRPEIIVPRWLLDRQAEEQHMVIAHEAEHVRAGDPALLAAGCVALAVMPWNPAVWYMFSRLRLAVELDCDARVLRRGAAVVSAISYGTLLLDVAERAQVIRLNALALADDSSHLQQRILAMRHEHSRSALARAMAAGVVGVVAVLAACSAEMPTAADIQQADAATATKTAKKLALATGGDTTLTYIVDDSAVSAAAAKAIDKDRIESISINKSKTGGSKIYINTVHRRLDANGNVVGPDTFAVELPRKAFMADGSVGRGETAGVQMPFLLEKTTKKLGHAPLTFVDGVKVGEDALRRIDPETIASVEVIKGAAVARLYPNEPDAIYGVIQVTTKKH